MIEGFRNSFRAEWIRAFGTPGGRLTLALPPLAAALRVLLGRAFEGAGQARAVADAVRTGAEAPGVALSTNAFPPFVRGIAVGLGAAALLLLAYGALAIVGERDAGTMRAALVRPVSRGAWVLGKVCVGLCLALAAMPAVVLASAIVAAALYHFGPVVEQGYVIATSEAVLREISRGLSSGTLAVLSVFAFGVFVSSLARTPGLAVAGAMLGYLVFDAMKGLLGGASEWVFATFVPSLVDRSYLGEVAKFAEGYSDAGFEQATWVRNLLVPPVEGLFLVAAAVLVTRRRDA
ncbi:MAG TPA: ABC transporter permease subunit [Planctomycetota bacterium]|jgi:hypothetical protein|nr:ABC transporter permease subunit [Planctomycetota bacterium]